jgi:hypothetical protein
MSKDPKVGYRRPPTHARFKKGRSGNPKGRPQGARNFTTEIVEELDRKIRITEDGVTKAVPKRLAIIMRLIFKALEGDPRAIMTVFAMLRGIEASRAGEAGDRNAPLSADDAAILAQYEASLAARLNKETGSHEDRS